MFGATRVLNSILFARKILYHALIDVEVFCPGAHAAVVFILQRIPKRPLFVSASSDSVFFFAIFRERGSGSSRRTSLRRVAELVTWAQASSSSLFGGHNRPA